MIVGVLQGLTIGPLNKLMFKALSVLVICGATLLLVNIQLLQSGTFLQRSYNRDDSHLIFFNETDVKVEVLQPGLNHHVWEVYASNVDFLCNIPLFPKAPDSRKIVDNLEIGHQSRKGRYAERIFGFISPLISGPYKFAISSDESSELWLNSNDNDTQLIAHVGKRRNSRRTERNNFTTFPSQVSKNIELQAGVSYFIEILHVGRANLSHLTVHWKVPGKSEFSPINKHFLIPYIMHDYNPYNVFYDIEITQVKSCQNLVKSNKFLYEKHIAYSNHSTFSSLLPACQFANRRDLLRTQRSSISLSKYESLSERYFTKTFVYTTKPINSQVYDYGRGIIPWWGKVHLKKEKITGIVNLVLEKITRKFERNFTLKSIINVEKTNHLNGSRYLLELDLLTTSNDTVHFSEYIYQHNNTLCYLTPWRRDVTITFVLTAKDQGKWIHIFLDNMAFIIDRTQDANIKAVLFDYDSQDIILEEAVAWRGLEDRVKIVRKQGLYSRRESFNLAVQHVEDPHSIVFLLDLHLTIGDALINDIRKHTIEGHFIYTPIIARQWDFTTPNNGYYNWVGYYETQGYGIVGIYKSDWDYIGGFAEPYGTNKNATYKWGGEDYEFMDNVFKHGLEFARVKCPYVYHFKHSRKGMWNSLKKNGHS